MLSIRNAGRRLGSTWAWRGLSLELERGSTAALVGPSGSGKSLLLRAVTGLDRLDEGEIRFQGRSLDDWSLPEYRTRVVLIPQDVPRFGGDVETNLRMPFRLEAHRGREFRRERAAELLEQLGWPESFLGRRATDLSGGEAQAMNLVRGMLLDPEVLLFDEPTASLDAGRTERVEAVVAEWLEERGCAMIWTSHDAAQLERLDPDRVIRLEEGEG